MSEDELFGQLEGLFDGVEEETIDYTSWKTNDLLIELARLDLELMELEELLYVQSKEARELHSTRTAIIVELKSRKTM